MDEAVEIGFTCDDFEKNIEAFKNCSLHTFVDKETGRNMTELSEKTEDEDLYTVFSVIRFPIVGQGMYKSDIWRWYEAHCYLNIREKTIFCQAPVIYADGTWEPCGVCASCIEVVHSNLLEPFKEKALHVIMSLRKNIIIAPNGLGSRDFDIIRRNKWQQNE